MIPPQREKCETTRLKESRKQGLYAELEEGSGIENGGGGDAKRLCAESESPAGFPSALFSPPTTSAPLAGEADAGLAAALEVLSAPASII
jgi:hypothetical protein